jgi:hypothetical protein
MCEQSLQEALTSQGDVLEMSLHFHSQEPVMRGVWPIAKMASRHLFYCLDLKYLAPITSETMISLALT